jgi:hypothetical protein
MTNRDLAHAVDAVANQRRVVAGVTTALRRSVGADTPTRLDRERAVDGVICLLRRLQPKHTEQA